MYQDTFFLARRAAHAALLCIDQRRTGAERVIAQKRMDLKFALCALYVTRKYSDIIIRWQRAEVNTDQQ